MNERKVYKLGSSKSSNARIFYTRTALNPKMDEQKILEILDDWNFWNKDQDTGVKRKQYLSRIRPFLKTNQAIVLTGVRRSGKSTLLLQLVKELIESGISSHDTLIINLEDYRWEELSLQLLHQVYTFYLKKINRSRPFYLFLDEIHRITGWERFVRTLIDKKDAKIVVSGSNAKLISQELGTLLTGRHVELKIYPPTFKELLELRKLNIDDELDLARKRSEINNFVDEALINGFFPEIILAEEEYVQLKILRDGLDSIITRDVVERHKIKEKEKLRSLVRYYLSNASTSVSFNKLKETLNLPLRTIERFSQYLEEAYLIMFLKRFSYKVKEQEKSPRKVYSIDLGLINASGFKFMENKSRLMENMVFLELIKKEQEIYYWKNPQQEEVDFVVKDGVKIKQLIQVCFDINNFETKSRELRSLIKAGKELKCKDLLVVTKDYENKEKMEWFGEKAEIKFIPLWKWLLEK